MHAGYNKETKNQKKAETKMNLKDAIIYEDQELLVVYKEAGMAVQSAKRGTMDMEHLLLNYLAEGREAAVRTLPYLAVVHRLDQPVEGLLVFAKTKGAAASLSRQLQDGSMQKYYLAVTQGIPKKDSGTLTDYLIKDAKTNTSRVVGADYPGAKRAVLDYAVRKVHQGECMVEIRLYTGRHHQIRVQMAHAGMPLKNDRKYNKGAAGDFGTPALAAFRLAFFHPKGGKQMEFTRRPKGKDFQNIKNMEE